jgi:ferredoxin/flavodoxin---NADP+ reductase
MAKPLTYNATLSQRIDLTDSLAVFKVAPDVPIGGEGPWFVPGQYVVLGMNHPEKGPVRRAMSIASAPQQRDAIEFYIRFVTVPESSNPLTHLMWPTAAGDRVFMTTKATGRFTVEHTVGAGDPRLKVFVAAGTGLAPFVSIVRSRRLRDPNAALDDLVLLHGASYPEDLGYRDELDDARAAGLHYHVTVSRPKERPDWDGDAGRVEDYFLADRLADLEQRLGLEPGGLDPRRAVIYICGLQGTIGATITRLAARGFVPADRKIRKALDIPKDAEATLFYEQYDNAPVVDIADPKVVASLKDEIHRALAEA